MYHHLVLVREQQLKEAFPPEWTCAETNLKEFSKEMWEPDRLKKRIIDKKH